MEPQPCTCTLWCNHDLGVMLLTGHHENCPKNPGIMTATRTLLTRLVRGIEAWGGEGDGIAEEVWDAYCQAKTFIGETPNMAEPK